MAGGSWSGPGEVKREGFFLVPSLFAPFMRAKRRPSVALFYDSASPWHHQVNKSVILLPVLTVIRVMTCVHFPSPLMNFPSSRVVYLVVCLFVRLLVARRTSNVAISRSDDIRVDATKFIQENLKECCKVENKPHTTHTGTPTVPPPVIFLSSPLWSITHSFPWTDLPLVAWAWAEKRDNQ